MDISQLLKMTKDVTPKRLKGEAQILPPVRERATKCFSKEIVIGELPKELRALYVLLKITHTSYNLRFHSFKKAKGQNSERLEREARMLGSNYYALKDILESLIRLYLLQQNLGKTIDFGKIGLRQGWELVTWDVGLGAFPPLALFGSIRPFDFLTKREP